MFATKEARKSSSFFFLGARIRPHPTVQLAHDLCPKAGRTPILRMAIFRKPGIGTLAGSKLQCRDRQSQSSRRGITRRVLACFEKWPIMAEHLVRDQGVGGSNPLLPNHLFQSLTVTLWSAAAIAVGEIEAAKAAKIIRPNLKRKVTCPHGQIAL